MLCLTDDISKNLEFHLDSGSLLVDNVFRYGSESWAALIREARSLYNRGLIDDLDEEDFAILESHTGELVDYNGNLVMLEVPEIDHETNSYYVYVMHDDGVKLVHFQDESVTAS